MYEVDIYSVPYEGDMTLQLKTYSRFMAYTCGVRVYDSTKTNIINEYELYTTSMNITTSERKDHTVNISTQKNAVLVLYVKNLTFTGGMYIQAENMILTCNLS